MGTENDGYKRESKKGISLRLVNVAMVLLACVLAALLVFFTNEINGSYRDMQRVTEQYLDCRDDATGMMEGSDYLTEMVRQFVVTGDVRYARLFCDEIEQTRRRDLALEDLGRYFSGTDTYEFLRAALERSNALAQTEYYAMRLVADSAGIAADTLPDAVAKAGLSREDAALSREEKEKLAVELVFGEEYQAEKSGIRADVARCLDTLVESVEEQREESTRRYLGIMRGQTALAVALLAALVTSVVLANRMMMQPILRCVEHIGKNERMPESGAEEIRVLSRAYNEVFEQSRRNQAQLAYDATHDDLTGLSNRGVFEKLRCEDDRRQRAMILVDVDKFKEINDDYGHDVGDRILKKVADLLRASFRAEDHVCRIGGDEFAVVMIHAGSELRDLVYAKMERLNRKLQNPDDGLPAVSISVGVAFGDRDNPTDDIYKDADSALYRVKESGRAGCAFY